MVRCFQLMPIGCGLGQDWSQNRFAHAGGTGCAFIVFMRTSPSALALVASFGNQTQRQFVPDAIIAEQLLGSVSFAPILAIRPDQFRGSANRFIDHSRIGYQSIVP